MLPFGSKRTSSKATNVMQSNNAATKSTTKSKSSGVMSSLSQSKSDIGAATSTTRPTTTSSSSRRNNAAPSKDASALRTPAVVVDKSRDKTKSAGAKSTNSTSSSSGGKLSRKAREAASAKSKAASEREPLETKIKELLSLAKTKDTEIKSLKQKLDQMMLLLDNKRGDDGGSGDAVPPPAFSSLVKLSSDDDVTRSDDVTSVDDESRREVEIELKRLQAENSKLRATVDAMVIMSVKAKDSEQQQQQKDQLNKNDDTSSNDDGLSSSLDDVASAASGDLLQSVSRTASTDNLIEPQTNAANYQAMAVSRMDDNASETSSITVACLTERINRMQETHISTNEELEATVQELEDLQKSLPELTIDNDRLKREQTFLVEKLESAEKKLAEQTAEADHLRALVSDHLADDSTHSDLKQQYVRLLNERERLLQVNESLGGELRRSEGERKDQQEVVEACKERLRHLERELTQANADKVRLDKKLKEVKEKTEEEHARTLARLEEHGERQRSILRAADAQQSGDVEPSELLDIADALRHDKQELEDKYIQLEEEYRDGQRENDKLDARVACLEEELEAAYAKAKKDSSELSELIDRLNEDIRMKQASLEEANETLFVMEDSVEQHIAVKKHDNHIIQQLQNQISNIKEERFRLEKEIQQLKKEQRNQSEEWKQFQADLQMAVSIANDMKAETQAEVTRVREENQSLEDTVTKLRVENEQLRRKRVSSSVSSPVSTAAILEAAAIRQAAGITRQATVDGGNIAAYRESLKKRRSGEPSPGVASLIKSFDSQSNIAVSARAADSSSDPNTPSTPPTSPPAVLAPSLNDSSADEQSPQLFSPSKSGKIGPLNHRSGPVTATVSPMQRHHSTVTTATASPIAAQLGSAGKLQSSPNSAGSPAGGGSKAGTPDSSRGGGVDLAQLSSLLRRTSTQQESRKASLVDSRKPSIEMLEHRLPTQSGSSQVPAAATRIVTPVAGAAVGSKQRTISTSASSSGAGDPLATLARHYGGSKRNALLKWCQEKTEDYAAIDITNFSSSWSDGLALCALLHSYLPAHIPYNSLVNSYVVAATDERMRQQLQAKHFRLALAAAESVGIEPTLSMDEMTAKERPDWQRVMRYVTQLYKYFEG